jgi:hypothetical protein
VVTAYVDETGALELARYVTVALLVGAEDQPHTRLAMRSLALKEGRRTHWRAESAERRAKIAEAVAALGHIGVVILGEGATRKQERARRKCLECLLPEVDQLGARHVVFESRGAVLDRRDFHLAHAVRQKGIISGHLTVDFARPWRSPSCGPVTRSAEPYSPGCGETAATWTCCGPTWK